MRREEAISRLKAAEADIRQRGVDGLYLFGSAARDEAGAGSDIDVFVDPYPARRFGFDEFTGVYELLQKRLNAKLNYSTRDGAPSAAPRRNQKDRHPRFLMAESRARIRSRTGDHVPVTPASSRS